MGKLIILFTVKPLTFRVNNLQYIVLNLLTHILNALASGDFIYRVD